MQLSDINYLWLKFCAREHKAEVFSNHAYKRPIISDLDAYSSSPWFVTALTFPGSLTMMLETALSATGASGTLLQSPSKQLGWPETRMAVHQKGGTDRQTSSWNCLNSLVVPACLTVDVGACYKILKISNVVPGVTEVVQSLSKPGVGGYVGLGEAGGARWGWEAFKRKRSVDRVNRLRSGSRPNLFTKFGPKQIDWCSSDIKLWKLDWIICMNRFALQLLGFHRRVMHGK